MTTNEDALRDAAAAERFTAPNEVGFHLTEQIRRLVQENEALRAQLSTESFVQPVPDRCDRIVWRNRYYHLPPAPRELKPLTVEQIKLASDEAFAIVAKMPDEEVTGETWDEQFARAVERTHGIVEPPPVQSCGYESCDCRNYCKREGS